jgi:hypothetical protein
MPTTPSPAACSVPGPVTAPQDAILPIASLDLTVWPREEFSQDQLEHFRALLRAKHPLPPVQVQRGTTRLLDGHHRVAACEAEGIERVAVKYVELPDGVEPLLYAYRQDAKAAVAFTQGDREAVVCTLYKARSKNGQAANVAALARDLDLPRQTVARWVAQLVAEQRECQAIERQKRAVLVHTLLATGYSGRRTAELLGVSEGTVRSDARVSIATHLANEDVLEDARDQLRRIRSRAGGEAQEQAAVDAAFDWLDEQVEATYRPVTSPAGSDQPGIDSDPFDAGQEVDEQAADHQVADDQADSVRDASVLRPGLIPLLNKLRAFLNTIDFLTHGENAATAANDILQTVDELRGLLDHVAALVGAELTPGVDQVGAP